MEFEVYCDESLPDLFFQKKKTESKYLMIGGLWIEKSIRSDIKDEIRKLREKHNTWGEIKWSKVSPNKISFYEDLIGLFFNNKFQNKMKFRCIAINSEKVDFSLHGDDKELGFYKFYFLLLNSWIEKDNSYSIFCDLKTNHDLKRVQTLKTILTNSNSQSDIKNIQSLPSKEVVLIQFSDLLLGIATSRVNKQKSKSESKESLISLVEKKLKIDRLIETRSYEKKFNIFKLIPSGGW